MFAPGAHPVANEFIFNMMIYLTETLPTQALTAYSRAPVLGSKSLRDKAKMLKKI